MVKKTFAFLFALFLFIFLVFVPAEVSAFDLPATYDEYEEYDDFTESIPDDVKNSLPQGISIRTALFCAKRQVRGECLGSYGKCSASI